jgi:anti-sigma-K factor RskA
MVMSGCERGIDAGAWVLGALDERSVAAYEEHLRGCADCRAEVARLRVPADAMALATEQVAPPPELKDRIMRVVESEAQLLRATGPEADRAPQRERRRLRWNLRPLPLAGLAAATLAVGVAGGVLLSGGSSEHTRTIQAQVTMTGAHATLRVTGDRAKLEVSGMRNPPAGHVYQVWLQRGNGAPEPTDALFTVNVRGDGRVEVPVSVKGVDRILVTSEPRGGSLVPTSRPVIRAAV